MNISKKKNEWCVLKRKKKRIIHRDKYNYQAIYMFKYINTFNISKNGKTSIERMIGLRIINDEFLIITSFD